MNLFLLSLTSSRHVHVRLYDLMEFLGKTHLIDSGLLGNQPDSHIQIRPLYPDRWRCGGREKTHTRRSL